jgi:hypothetical protein
MVCAVMGDAWSHESIIQAQSGVESVIVPVETAMMVHSSIADVVDSVNTPSHVLL